MIFMILFLTTISTTRDCVWFSLKWKFKRNWIIHTINHIENTHTQKNQTKSKSTVFIGFDSMKWKVRFSWDFASNKSNISDDKMRIKEIYIKKRNTQCHIISVAFDFSIGVIELKRELSILCHLIWLSDDSRENGTTSAS